VSRCVPINFALLRATEGSEVLFRAFTNFYPIAPQLYTRPRKNECNAPFSAKKKITPTEEPVMNTGTTVLYVNDNPKSLRLLSSILEDCGFEVRTAAAPWAAIELIHSHTFALALLNYQLSDMTGVQLAEEIRGLDVSLPIVLMSGMSSLPAGELAYVDAHIGRDASVEDLTHLMRQLMNKDRSVAESVDLTPWRSIPFAPGSR
jgi:CheY-like chemotaxis protein